MILKSYPTYIVITLPVVILYIRNFLSFLLDLPCGYNEAI